MIFDVQHLQYFQFSFLPTCVYRTILQYLVPNRNVAKIKVSKYNDVIRSLDSAKANLKKAIQIWIHLANAIVPKWLRVIHYVTL